LKNMGPEGFAPPIGGFSKIIGATRFPTSL